MLKFVWTGSLNLHEGKFQLDPEEQKGWAKGSEEWRDIRKMLRVPGLWSLKSHLDLQEAAQYLCSPRNVPKLGTVSRCTERLLQSSPKLKVWRRVSAAWAGNTLRLGELGSSAGRRGVGWNSNIHRGRKWDLATERFFLKSEIWSAYEYESFTLNNYTVLRSLALLFQSLLVFTCMINFILNFTPWLLLKLF